MGKLKEVWAYVAKEGEDERIIQILVPRHGRLPLVGNQEPMERARPLAESAARANGCVVKLVKFAERTTVEVIDFSEARHDS